MVDRGYLRLQKVKPQQRGDAIPISECCVLAPAVIENIVSPDSTKEGRTKGRKSNLRSRGKDICGSRSRLPLPSSESQWRDRDKMG